MNSVICPYNKEWISMFQDLSDFLKLKLETYIRIEHVGSTSIPGMDAKPVIDIDIEIPSKAVFKQIKKELEVIGYIYCGDLGIEGREAFIRSENGDSVLDTISHNLYVCASDNDEYKRHILFREKLKSNKKLREEYKAIKYEILEKVGSNNRQGYVKMKENHYKSFFKIVLSDHDQS